MLRNSTRGRVPAISPACATPTPPGENLSGRERAPITLPRCSPRGKPWLHHRNDQRNPLQRRFGRLAWGFAVALALALLLTFGIGWLLAFGVGIWGLNIPVAWSFAITDYVWWIAIGMGGTFISGRAVPRCARTGVPRSTATRRR